MFKDYDKYLSTSLKVYIFVLLCVFIMKIVGLDYFGLTTDNEILNKASKFLSTTHWGDLVSFAMIYLQFYFYLCIVCKKNKLYIASLVGSLVNYIIQIILIYFSKMNYIYGIISVLIMIIIPIIINKKFMLKRQILCILMIYAYQHLSLFIRSIGVHQNYGNFLIDTLLNIDELLLLAITYNLLFMKGGFKLCGEELEVGFYSLKKIHLRKSLKRLQENLHKFRLLPKEEKLSISIYIFLSLIWNTFTIVLIFIIAKLNNTLIECLFIVTSFWLSKHSFGKPFHLSSMLQCFIVSNISYYILNRITTPLGISIFVPILLGVGLSYLTSKLVKKTYKPLYKGMPKELFEETILKVTDKDSLKYKVCYDFYIRGKSDLSLSFEYNYSLPGIRKIKNRINDKIRELN